jgi:hypothetical protein
MNEHKQQLAINLLEYFERELIDWGTRELERLLATTNNQTYKIEKLDILEELTGKTQEILDDWRFQGEEIRESDEQDLAWAKK